MLTGGTAFDATTGDGLATNVGPMRGNPRCSTTHARAAAREPWLLRTERPHDADDPDGRSSHMLLFFVRCCARDRNARTRPAAATYRPGAKRRDATMNTKKRRSPR
jgi:hypothetical protein